MLGEWFRALARNISKKAGDKKDKLRNYQVRDFIKDRKIDKKEDALKNMGVKNAEEVAEKDKSFNHKRIEFLKNKLKLEIASDRLKVLTLYVTSFIVDTIQAVIKMLIILLSNIYIVILLGAVVVVIALFSALAVIEEGKTTKPEQPQVSDQINQGQQGGSGASWTLEELAIRGGMLSTYEKNLYKLIMLSNNAITGVYDGKPVTYPEGSDFALPLRFAVGIFSTENSGVMYLSGENTKDILVTPTDDTEINSSGYGSLFGIHHTDTLSRYYDDATVSKIKQMFPTSYTGNEIFFIPYGSGISVKHFNDKLQYGLNLIKKRNLEDDARSVIKSFGIVKGEEEVYRFCIYMLATALYHGGNIFDFPDITAFISALYASTSDKDEERSFDKIEYCYTDKYDESNFRLAVIGSCGYANVDNYSTPLDLPKSSTSAYFKVGNDTVKEPLWAYLYRKHSSNVNMVKAWNKAKEYASGSLAVRVLNFHYGLNSYLQGDRIIKRIEGKLTGTTPSNGGNNNIPSGSNAKIEAMIDMAYKMLGLPYKLGATTIILNPDGTYSGTFDCAYFTYYLFKQQGVTMSAWSYGQYWDKIGTFVEKKDIQRGDLIFFEKTYVPSQHRDPMITHVGIALGDGKMIHQGGTEVHISDLNSDYYTKHYHSAKRIPLN